MDKEKCKKLLNCKNCVYYNSSQFTDECIKLGMRYLPKNFGCVEYIGKEEKIGSCYSCMWKSVLTNNIYSCNKHYTIEDNPFIIKECYAYNPDELKFYPYPNRIPTTNKIKLNINSTLSTLLGSLLLLNIKKDAVIDNTINYSICLSDFYTNERYMGKFYKKYKEKMENEIVNILIDIEELLKQSIDENKWLNGLINIVRHNNISILNLINHTVNPVTTVIKLTKEWLNENNTR